MMFKFITQFKAIDQESKDLLTYAGPHIKALTWNEAESICSEKYPYLEVIGRLESTIPTKIGSLYEPDYEKEVNFWPYSDN